VNHLQVEADLKNIGFIEEFISTSKDIPESKRATALIISTEVFDNIAEHAVFAESKELRLSASNMFFPRLCFSYCISCVKLLVTLNTIHSFCAGCI